MNTKLCSIFILFICLSVSAQIEFEKGYIINNQNQRIECLIKNRDWMNAPKQIEYKLSEESVTEVIQSSQINTIQIYNTSHYYKKYTVEKDKNIDQKNFSPKLEQTFLKVLIDGGASLYIDDEDIFFYQKAEGNVKQLVYKKYVDENSKIIEDLSFRTELYNELKCFENDAIKVRKLAYKKSDLVTFFKESNQCTNTDFTDYTKKGTAVKFNFRAFAEMNFNNLKSDIGLTVLDLNRSQNSIQASSKSSNIAFGLEIELLLPLNKNKWALIVSPNYQSLKINSSSSYYDALEYFYLVQSTPSQGGGIIYLKYDFDFNLKTEYSYSFVEVPIGLRHYFNLSKTSKLFVDGTYGFVFHIEKPSESVKLEQINNLGHPDIKTNSFNKEMSSTIKLGMGYTYMDKYSLGLNFYPHKQISNSKGSSFSVSASYKLF